MPQIADIRTSDDRAQFDVVDGGKRIAYTIDRVVLEDFFSTRDVPVANLFGRCKEHLFQSALQKFEATPATDIEIHLARPDLE